MINSNMQMSRNVSFLHLPVNRILLIIPGKIVVNKGRILRYAAKMEPPLTWCMFLAAKDR